MSETALALPHVAPYTTDDLFEIPDDGDRYELLGGSLHMSSAPGSAHQIAVSELWLVLRTAVRRHGVRAVPGVTVRTAERDSPVPDITVTTADTKQHAGALPCDEVHSVVEVVSPSSKLIDRAYKRALYAESGIPCYWRVELEPSRRDAVPRPLIVVRIRDADGWRTVEAAAGKVAELPLAIGRVRGRAHTVPVELDPADLVDP